MGDRRATQAPHGRSLANHHRHCLHGRPAYLLGSWGPPDPLRAASFDDFRYFAFFGELNNLQIGRNKVQHLPRRYTYLRSRDWLKNHINLMTTRQEKPKKLKETRQKTRPKWGGGSPKPLMVGRWPSIVGIACMVDQPTSWGPGDPKTPFTLLRSIIFDV